MVSKDWEEIFAVLWKKKKITAGEVARDLPISEALLSRIRGNKLPLTQKKFDLFNKRYGHIIMLDPALLGGKAKKGITADDALDTPEALRATIRAVQELLLETYEKAFQVDRAAARQALGRKLVESSGKVHKKGIRTR